MKREFFIEKFFKKYPDKKEYYVFDETIDEYDYNKKMKVKCLKIDKFGDEHSYFNISPAKLMIGQCCPKCSGKHRRTTEEFINECIKIHGDKFDYSETVFKNVKTKVKIKCNVCGNLFLQSPSEHLKINDCPKCVKEKLCDNFRMGKDEFVRRAKEVHGDLYSYDKVVYKNRDTNVIITCPIHGDFEIIPVSHLKGKKCEKCSGYIRKYTNETFTEKANKIHNFKYDYTKTIFKNSHEHVIITCPIHGDFKQTPSEHLQGYGCRLCNESHIERDVKHMLEVNNIIYKREVTFGIDRLRYDFYLPEYNTIIECQGIQHFEPTPFKMSNVDEINKSFLSCLERDFIKYKRSLEQKYNLYYYVSIETSKYNIFENSLYNGIYKNNNTFNNLKDLINEIIG